MDCLRATAFAVVVAAALGCNSIAGINEPKDKAPGSSGGGGGGGGGGGSDPSPYAGTWKTAAAKREIRSCTDGSDPVNATVMSEATITPESGSVLTFKIGGCGLTFELSGETASLTPAGQQCMLTLDNGGIVIYTYDTGSTLTFASDGTKVDLDLTAHATFPDDSSCIYAEVSRYLKDASP